VDATTLGELLVGAGAVLGAVVAYLGKRGETFVTGLNSLTDQLQEERADLRQQIADLNAKYAELCALRAADQAELARLRALVISLGGSP
jgi:type II secretory pathway component PulM